MKCLSDTLQTLFSSRDNRRIQALRRKNQQNCLRVEPLEQRALLAGVSISDATINEIGSASAFVAASSGGLSSPKDLTIGPDGNLYVASVSANNVLRYNGTTGQFLGTFVAASSGGLTAPYGLAFGPDGNLYVGSEGTNAVYRYHGSSGAFIDAYVPTGSGGLNVPKGLVFGVDGNLYVSSRDSNSILRYHGPSDAAPGSPLPAAGQNGATFVVAGSGGMGDPHDLTFGPDGNLYVASTITTNAGILKFDRTSGSFLSTFVAPGTGGLSSPRGLAFDQDGRLYVSDIATSAIHRFSTQGQAIDDLVSASGTTLRMPVGLTFDSQGALLISSRDTHEVVRYDSGIVVSFSAASPTPVSVDYQAADGTASAGFDYSALTGTVTFAPGQTSRRVLLATRDDLLVEGNEVFSVQLMNATGGATIADSSATVTIADDDITRQYSITDALANEGDRTAHYRGSFVDGAHGGHFNPLTFGPDGLLYTAVGTGIGYNTIQRYDGTTGAFIDTFLSDPRINGVRDIVFRGGYLYVASTYTDEVFRYNASTGAFVDVFVTAGSGGIGDPDGMAFGPDTNNDGVPELYVTGWTSHSVVRYDGATGQVLGTYITPGSGGLSNPFAFAFDSTNSYIYVTSAGTNQILKYNGQTGAYVGVAASAGLDYPRDVMFGPDGLMYVTSGNNDRILRFTASGTYVDDYVPAGAGGMDNPRSIVIGPDGNLYVTATGNRQILRFGTESEAVFTVSLSTSSTLPLTVDFATADGTATAGFDYRATYGRLTFGPGVTSKVILVPTQDDGLAESRETFSVNLSNAVGGTIFDGSASCTIRDDDATKFYVVNDASSGDRTYEYADGTNSVENYSLNSGNSAPRGAASTAAGDKTWVVDANKKVYVYNPAGGLLGSWTAGSLQSTAQVEGITTNGTDVWIVDNKSDKLYKYTGAASRTSGSQNAASSFSLNSGNSNPKDIVTDGTHLWVVNDSTTDKVFKYTLSGSLAASWTIATSGAGSPTGITLDPSNPAHLWIVDSGTDRVYEYSNSVNQPNGSSKSANTSFTLAAGNNNPQGIADPPPQESLLTTEPIAVSGPAAVASAFVLRSVATVPGSLLREWTSELSGQNSLLVGQVTQSSNSTDPDRQTSVPGQSKTSARKQLSSALSQADQMTPSEITTEADLDVLFADWSTDPLQLLLSDAK